LENGEKSSLRSVGRSPFLVLTKRASHDHTTSPDPAQIA